MFELCKVRTRSKLVQNPRKEWKEGEKRKEGGRKGDKGEGERLILEKQQHSHEVECVSQKGISIH